MKQIETAGLTGNSRRGPTLSSYLPNWPVMVLLGLAGLILFWKLGQGTLNDWDEAIYAQISKEIVHSGNWLTLHWGYYPWFHKPPLFMWSTALLYQWFGVSEFWARATSAVSGMGLVLMTYAIGKHVYGQSVGFCAAIVLLTSYSVVKFARFGTTDIMLALFIWLAVYAYLKLEGDNPKWWHLVWLACALALMTKGLAGMIAPMTIAISVCLDRKIVATVKSRHFWQGLLLAAAIILPWHIVMVGQYGRAFIDVYFGYHVIARSTQAIEGHAGGLFYYVGVLQKQFFPWCYLVIFALILSLKDKINRKSQSHILLVLLVLVFGLFTIAKTKLAWYILPVYPILAIFIANLLKQALNYYRSLAFMGLTISAVIVAALAPYKIVFLNTNQKEILSFIALGLLFVLLSLVVAKKVSYRLATVIICTAFLLVGMREVKGLYYGKDRPVAILARTAGSVEKVSRREPLLVVKLSSNLNIPTTLFYSNRPILWARTPEEIADFMKASKPPDSIMGKKDIVPLSADYEINVLSKSGTLIYGKIKPH